MLDVAEGSDGLETATAILYVGALGSAYLKKSLAFNLSTQVTT
jgi:hypothetical protein